MVHLFYVGVELYGRLKQKTTMNNYKVTYNAAFKIIKQYSFYQLIMFKMNIVLNCFIF